MPLTIARTYREFPIFPSVFSLLKFGQIRPVKRPIIKLLGNLTQSPRLKTIWENHTEQDWELWDLLELLQGEGFDPKELWKPTNYTPKICQVIPPEAFRLYSISSILDRSENQSTTSLDLTVGLLKYHTSPDNDTPPKSRRGTASHFLASGSQDPITLKIIPSPHFHLPEDESCPIVMFAGGTGISPFRSFIQQRVNSQSGENWLFFGTKTRGDFYYQQEWEQWIDQGKLRLSIAFSQEDIAAKFVHNPHGGQFQFSPSHRHRIGEEIQRPENLEQLWQLLRGKEAGGLGAYFYVCGRTGFAHSVLQALQKLLEQVYEGSKEQKQKFAQETLERLMAEGRYMQETFTPFAGALEQASGVYPLSEIALHNNPEQGYWLIIEDVVYDVTSLLIF